MITIDIQGSIWGIYQHGRYINSRQYIEMVVDKKGIITSAPENMSKWKNQSIHEFLNYIKIEEAT